jgi:hypothetical protein
MRKNNMEPQEDVIVDIPADRIKFFGGTGKMLLPGPATEFRQDLDHLAHYLLP